MDAAVELGALRGMRLVVGYAAVTALLVASVAVSLAVGRGEQAAPDIAGVYAGACFGDETSLAQSGQFVELSGGATGSLRLREGRLVGDVTCADGTSLAVPLTVEQLAASFVEELPAPGEAAPAERRSGEETFGRLMLAMASILLAARLVGAAIGRLGQPRVMGEVLAGILLGPSLLGAVWPEAKDYLFPGDIVPLLAAAAMIGLAFYLFLVGMELDPRILRRHVSQAAFISNASVAVPMALGFLVALPVYELLSPAVDFAPFALFMGVAMSTTAFPVLARILIERKMLKGVVGTLALASAAIGDVTAWALLALASAIAGAGSGMKAFQVVALAALFSAAMLLVGRPLLGRVARAYDEVGQVPALWIGTIFVCVLLAAFVSQRIGIAAIFGAFVVGLVMPRHGELTVDVSRRLEDFVIFVLLPLFFVVTGLRTEIGSLDRPVLWLVTLLLIAVAIAGKWLGAMLAARYGGFGRRDSAVIGVLLNTRGLTELIVLNIGLELGVISPVLFTMLVVMALVTTFMAGPLLKLLDPRGALGTAAEEELRAADRQTTAPERAILVAPQDERNLDSLLALAEPLARSTPPRELVMVRVVVPERLVTGAIRDEEELTRIAADLNARRAEFQARGIATRAAAFASANPAGDYLRLAREDEIDLILLDGRRPLLGEGVPRGAVGDVLDHAPCDVAVLVERAGVPEIGAEHPVFVPFGGGDHDWAALELGVWIASARDAPLKLVGAAEASRLLGDASLVVQQLAGVAVEPVLVEPGEILRATEQAGLLVVGLSERWRSEGLGDLRATIAKGAAAPILFVRRGTRPGALSPRDSDVTRYSWSFVGPA